MLAERGILERAVELDPEGKGSRVACVHEGFEIGLEAGASDVVHVRRRKAGAVLIEDGNRHGIHGEVEGEFGEAGPCAGGQI